LKQFQEKAHSFKDRHFAAKAAEEGSMIDVSEEEVELEFWRLTESLTETVEVEYGADIHSTTHGSGFPTIERRPFSPYSTDPWNLNVLPLDKDSLFRHIKTDISGMTVPWLYVGMCFSTFCWHNEDHYTYSANYQHFGDTKTWYGIPSGDSERFEAAMQEAVPELFEQQPDLLFQLVTLLQPEKLVKSGVQVYALDQRAGEFVITFPQAYHAGFNHGFNFNEAVNFAPSDWEPFGGAAIQRLRDFRRQPVFSHDELLFSAAKRDHSIKTSKWLAGALDRVVRAEILSRDDFHDIFQDQQKKLVAQGAVVTEKSLSYLEDATDIADEEIVCAYCKSYGYLSRLICINSQRVVCLKHAGTYDCCSADEGTRIGMMDGRHCLRFRMTNGDLEKIVKKVMDIAKTPDVWQDKVDALLEDEPTPSLKALRALVGEGERIDASWPLPGLVDLRVYVARCNAWVEEATAFIARKPNRRKSEFRVRLSGSDEVRKKPDREEARREMRNPDSIKRLLNTAIELSFDCPEREKLQERYDKICEFRKKARSALNLPHITETELDELLEEGKELDVDLPEIKSLDTRGRTVRWFAEAKELSEKLSHGKMNPDDPMSLDDVTAFIERGKNLEIMENDQYMKFFLSSRDQGEFWTNKTREVMGNEHINYTQLNALWEQARRSPVDKTILAQIDGMLKKQREAQEKIMYLYERTKERVFQNRPTYKEVRETMEAVDKLNSKPPGTLDLEREQRRHEDWMRRGKKLFGKANAPLHILLQHMQHVRERNEACLDLKDEPRGPVEPASREVTPDFATANGSNSIRDVFCICRKPESGMMIECELCHEWYEPLLRATHPNRTRYHGRCLKIARGKVKEDDKYTCPICDYRLKIPRDAARPRLEDLQFWQEDIPMLPFQPDEEEVLASIIDTAVKFREYIQNIIAPIISTPDDLTNQRFYLRKVEGADVLLVDETNYLRQQLHRWAPVAPEPPKGIEVSLSTRKPRPTKVQKLMTQLGVNSIQEVPEHLRPKISRRRVINNASGKGSNPERPSGAAKPGESVNPWSFDRRPPSLTLGAPDLPIELMDSPSSPRSSTMTTPGGAFDGRFGGDDVGSQPRPGGLPTGTLDTKDLMRGVNTEFRGGRDEKRRDSTGGTGTGPSRSSERDFERRASAGGERRGSAMSPSAMGPGDAADRHRGESGGRQFQFRGGAGSLPLESPRLTQPPRAWNDDRFAAGGQPEHRRGSMGQRSAETSPSTEQQGFGMVDPALVSPTNMRAMQHPSPHSHHGHHARVGSMDSAGSARRVSVGGYGGSMSGGNVDPSLDNMFGPPAPAQQAPGQAMAGAAAEAPMALDDGGPLEDARMMMDERNSTEDLFGSLTNGAGAEGEEFSFAPAGGFEEEERRY
jgi:histone demethylase JARID1